MSQPEWVPIDHEHMADADTLTTLPHWVQWIVDVYVAHDYPHSINCIDMRSTLFNKIMRAEASEPRVHRTLPQLFNDKNQAHVNAHHWHLLQMYLQAFPRSVIPTRVHYV